MTVRFTHCDYDYGVTIIIIDEGFYLVELIGPVNGYNKRYPTMSNRQRIYCFVFLIPVLWGRLTAAREEQWLQYRYSPDSQKIVKEIGFQTLELSRTRPEGVHLPELKDREPIFAKWMTPMVKKGYIWLLLIRSNPRSLYDQLCIDSNCDGRLDNDKVIQAYRTYVNKSYFGPVGLVFDSHEGPISFHLNLRYYEDEGGDKLKVHAGGWYEGTVTVAEQLWQCVLVDQNVNGTFNDKSLDFDQADRISVGPKDNPRFRLVGTFLEIGETLYELEVSRSGAFVVFSLTQGVEYGEVGLPKSVVSFGSGGCLGQFEKIPEDGIVRLPVGQYRIEHWAVKRIHQGQIWRVEGQVFDNRGIFHVSSAQKTELNVGEPLYANLHVSQNDGEYILDTEFKGDLGERITLLRNGIKPSPPTLHLRNKTGAYQRTLHFEYG